METTDNNIVLLFDYARETKNKILFVERGDDPMQRKIYLDKKLLKTWGDPRTIRAEYTPSKD